MMSRGFASRMSLSLRDDTEPSSSAVLAALCLLCCMGLLLLAFVVLAVVLTVIGTNHLDDKVRWSPHLTPTRRVLTPLASVTSRSPSG